MAQRKTRLTKEGIPVAPRNIDIHDGRVHMIADGASSKKFDCGGWGTVLLFGERKLQMYGGGPGFTNNQMELTGILKGFEALRNFRQQVCVYSDSKYAIQSVTQWRHGWARNGWRTASGSAVKNVDLIRAIGNYLDMPKLTYQFHWVKGHSGHEWNELADNLAGRGKKEYEKEMGETTLL